MRKISRTLIGSVRQAVITWRKREGWTREAVAQHIADEYHKGDGPVVTEIEFNPPNIDVFKRMHANADRIFRWLDDETKDSNLLPANILPYILRVLPRDLRIECVNELLEPAELSVMILNQSVEADLLGALKRMYKETGEANAAAIDLLDGATPEELRLAQREFTEAIAAFQALLPLIETRLANGGLDE